MKKLILLLILMPNLVMAGTTNVSLSGNKLYEMLNHKDEKVVWLGGWYIVGVMDSLASHKILCLPDSMVGAQGIDIVKKFLADKPEYRHTVASQIVEYSLIDSFGCH